MSKDLERVKARLRRDREFAEITVSREGQNLTAWTNLTPTEVAEAVREARLVLSDNLLTYPQHYDEESRQQPGEKRNLKLTRSIIPDFGHVNCLILEYQWDDTLSDKEAERLGARAVAYIACAIYDAAITEGLFCRASEIPHGRRPAWYIAGEKVPIALTLSDIDISDRICQMTIGAMGVVIGAPPGSRTHWEKLQAGFRARFSNISV